MLNMKTRSGFTLIELLVVIGLIMILTTVVITSLSSSQAQARDNARMTDLKNMQLALERFRADTGSFPEGGLNWWTNLMPEYISNLPDEWDWDYQTTDTYDRYILTIAGAESILTNEEHKFACPASGLDMVSNGHCSGIVANPNTVYAVYSAGVREF